MEAEGLCEINQELQEKVGSLEAAIKTESEHGKHMNNIAGLYNDNLKQWTIPFKNIYFLH